MKGAKSQLYVWELLNVLSVVDGCNPYRSHLMRQGRQLLASSPMWAHENIPTSQMRSNGKGGNHVCRGLQGICSYSTVHSASLLALELPLCHMNMFSATLCRWTIFRGLEDIGKVSAMSNECNGGLQRWYHVRIPAGTHGD